MSVLFLILFLSLFIPTNYPDLIEALLAVPLGILLLRYRSSATQNAAPDTAIFALWLFTLIILAGGSFFSRSSGMSLITFIRYGEGFAICILASSYSINHEIFSRHMKAFGLLSSAVFLMLISIYSLGITPYYSSFTGINGHHPIAYTIIMTIPFVIAIHSQKIILMQFDIFGISLILSAARSAWAIGVIFFSSQAASSLSIIRRGQKTKNSDSKQTRRNLHVLAMLMLLITALIVAAYLSTLPDTQKEKTANTIPILRPYIKDTNAGMRMAFAAQAITALKESPIIGHGPGTFSLLSRQYQTRSGLFSQYAHSFPLETLAENGIMGSMGIAALFILILNRALRALKSANSAPLGWAAILAILYSLIEVNLNSLPHWLMLWVIVGALTHNTPKNHARSYRGIAVLGGIILSVFSLSFLVSAVLMAGKNTKTALIVAPYSKSIALRHIAASPILNNTEIHLIQRWHKSDPDILMALTPYKAELLPLALAKDPQNTYYLKEYFTYLLMHENHTTIINLLCKTSEGAADPVCPLTASRPFTAFIADKTHMLGALNYLSGNDGHAKFLYFLGVALYTYTGDAASTTYLWQKAQEAAPQWGYYYLEIAGAQYHWLNDASAAQKTIALCMQHPLASKGCKLVTDITDLLRPGLYSRDIIIIPALQ